MHVLFTFSPAAAYNEKQQRPDSSGRSNIGSSAAASDVDTNRLRTTQILLLRSPWIYFLRTAQ